MGADKIFVLILSLAFATFIGYLMWRSRKNEANPNPTEPDRPEGNAADEPLPGKPPAAEQPASGKKVRNRSRRR